MTAWEGGNFRREGGGKFGSDLTITALAHRLCRILYAILRDGSEFDLVRLGVEKGPFKVTQTRHYRLRKAVSTAH